MPEPRNILLNLPRDQDSHPVQALRPGDSVSIAVNATSARVPVPAGAAAVMLSCIEAAWFRFGDSSVVAVSSGANSVLLPGGALIVIVPSGVTHIAAIRQGTDGPFCVTLMQ